MVNRPTAWSAPARARAALAAPLCCGRPGCCCQRRRVPARPRPAVRRSSAKGRRAARPRPRRRSRRPACRRRRRWCCSSTAAVSHWRWAGCIAAQAWGRCRCRRPWWGRAGPCFAAQRAPGLGPRWADTIKPTVPATRGELKLVPTMMRKLSVQVGAFGPWGPVSVAGGRARAGGCALARPLAAVAGRASLRLVWPLSGRDWRGETRDGDRYGGCLGPVGLVEGLWFSCACRDVVHACHASRVGTRRYIDPRGQTGRKAGTQSLRPTAPPRGAKVAGLPARPSCRPGVAAHPVPASHAVSGQALAPCKRTYRRNCERWP